MAVMNRMVTPSRAQVAAERIASLSGEQQRLKAAAAARRAASAREGEEPAAGFSVRRQRATTIARSNRYLRC